MSAKKKKKKNKSAAAAARRRKSKLRKSAGGKRPRQQRASVHAVSPAKDPGKQPSAEAANKQPSETGALRGKIHAVWSAVCAFLQKIPRTPLALALVFFGVICFAGALWTKKTWPFLSVDEFKYHTMAPVNGTSSTIVISGLLSIVFPAVILTAAAWALLVYTTRRKKHRFLRMRKVLTWTGLGGMLLGIVLLWVHLDVTSYILYGHTTSEIIDEVYVAPEDANIHFPNQKRNLIYIFLESVEMTYADESVGGAFEKNVIPELTQLALENECFSGDDTQLNGGHQSTGASWTSGAMFAQSAGLPFPSSLANNVKVSNETFLPLVYTLGDVLEDNGYHCALLIGSRAEFGARDYYYRSHGNYDILDYPYYLSTGDLPEGYAVWWGYEDEKLFGFAKDELSKLSSADEPFALTLLTADTHFEDGYVCDRCKKKFGKDQYSNVMACSSKQVAAFVRWCQKQDFYKDTTIILCGDHLTMDSDYCKDVSNKYDRRVYTAFINSAVEPILNKTRDYITLDLFPTTLTAIGAEFNGDRLGLGTDLFSATPTLAEEYGVDRLDKEFYKYSVILDRLTSWEAADEE